MIRNTLVTLLVTAGLSVPAAAQVAPVTTFSPATRSLLARSDSHPAAAFGARQAVDQPRDSRLNGFIIGFIAGAVPGVVVGMGLRTYCENESANCTFAVPLFGGLFGLAGGGIGYAIDGAVNSRSNAMRPPPPVPSMRFSFRF